MTTYSLPLFSSVVQVVVIASTCLVVSAVGLYAVLSSAKGSSRYQYVLGALVCTTLLPFILAWGRHEFAESYRNSLRGMIGQFDPSQEAADLSIIGRERYVLIWIGASGVAWMGASLLLRKGAIRNT
jgi:hypothetical protein